MGRIHPTHGSAPLPLPWSVWWGVDSVAIGASSEFLLVCHYRQIVMAAGVWRAAKGEGEVEEVGGVRMALLCPGFVNLTPFRWMATAGGLQGLLGSISEAGCLPPMREGSGL